MVSSDLTQGYTVRDPYIRNEQYKRCSRASDTSSAYSGSDMMQSSLDDQENGDSDLPSNLMESLVDSDEEEGFGESTEVFHVSYFYIIALDKVFFLLSLVYFIYYVLPNVRGTLILVRIPLASASASHFLVCTRSYELVVGFLPNLHGYIIET